MTLAPDFDEFIGCLTAHGVEFVVVGAYALVDTGRSGGQGVARRASCPRRTGVGFGS